MSYKFKTEKVCAKEITFDLDGDIVHNVKFLGGCPGQSQALPVLVEGMTVEEINRRLSGINCAGRGTSCADQLAKAVKNAYNLSQNKLSKQNTI